MIDDCVRLSRLNPTEGFTEFPPEFFSTPANNLLRPPPTVEGIVKGWKPLPMARLSSPTSSLSLSLDGGRAFTLEYTRQPPSCASIQPADMCRINYISVNGLSGELA